MVNFHGLKGSGSPPVGLGIARSFKFSSPHWSHSATPWSDSHFPCWSTRTQFYPEAWFSGIGGNCVGRSIRLGTTGCRCPGLAGLRRCRSFGLPFGSCRLLSWVPTESWGRTGRLGGLAGLRCYHGARDRLKSFVEDFGKCCI